MKAEQFADALLKISPDRTLLENEGFEDIHLDIIQRCYALNKKTPGNSISTHNSITTLITEYECQYIRFNDYVFNQEIITVDDFFCLCRDFV